MNAAYKIGLVACVAAGIFAAGYWQGRQHGREATLKAAMQAYQSRGQINETVQNLNPVALCLALGGLRDECADLMRGLAEAASGQ